MSCRARFTQFMYFYGHHSTSIKFQVVLVIISSAILGTFIYQKSIGTEDIYDPTPPIFYLTPATYYQASQIPTDIVTGMTINDFSVFDITKNKFVMRGIVWFIYDPIAISLDTIEQFTFFKGTILKKSKPEVKIIQHNKAFARYEIQLEFNSDLNFQDFPFDNHRIFIMMSNLSLERAEALFTTTQSYFKMEDRLYTTHPRIITHLQVQYGYTKTELIPRTSDARVERPVVVFSFDYIKPGIRSILLIIIPILLMFFMALFPLSLDPTTHAREIFGTSIGVLTSILTYRFVIESLSPQVDYLSIGDYLYIFVLLCAFGLFLFNSLAIRNNAAFSALSKAIRFVMVIMLHLSMIIFMYFLLNYWM